MKKFIAAALAVSAVFVGVAPADAAGGCGRGFHRGPRGGCRPNAGPAVIRGGPAIGVFYGGRGYWDGHRYWQHRERFHGGWRYR